MNREELLKSPVFWTTELQMELYRQIDSYMQTHSMNKAQLAAQLGCTKSYVSQLLAGNFDHKMSKFFELTLAIGKIPEFTFHDVDEYIEEDNNTYESVILDVKSAEANVDFNTLHFDQAA
jgi:transcriptional regulator with XRE-family HTH domain